LKILSNEAFEAGPRHLCLEQSLSESDEVSESSSFATLVLSQ
jgi:hypothetical protein